jgi:hypothetical protein
MNERDKTAHMMQASAGTAWGTEAHFQEFADLIRADELEKVIKYIQDYPEWLGDNAKREIIEAIRAKGNT